MENIFNITLFGLAIIYLHSHLGIPQAISNRVASLFFKRTVTLGKPFSCLQCTTFWAVLIYSLIWGILPLYSFYIALFFCFVADFLSNLLTFLIKAMDTLTMRMFQLFD